MSIGTTISSPHESQTYVASWWAERAEARRRFRSFFRRFFFTA
jgi:hypothetical protein